MAGLSDGNSAIVPATGDAKDAGLRAWRPISSLVSLYYSHIQYARRPGYASSAHPTPVGAPVESSAAGV